LGSFYLGQFFENHKNIFRLPFRRLRLCINFDKNGLGYNLGDFFQKTDLVAL
jgi:hypothetical protein